MSEIHPTAVVDARARLGREVRVGPLCYVGPEVELGDGCVLHPHVTLLGPATFGINNVIHPQCTLGAAPQDLKYKGGPTALVVGDNNVFRENVTVHRGTEVDRRSEGRTRVGDNNLLMVGVHVAHDADLANHIILANQVQVAGHVRIEDCVTVGGASAMHHFVTVGRNAFVAGMTRITHDVPPYMKVQGYDQEVRGANVEGMRRWHIDEESITAMKAATRLLYARRGERSPGRMVQALREIENDGLLENEHVRYLVNFLQRKLDIGIFGRVREHYRTDRPEDRAAFYKRVETEPPL
jgi:UDP-N-acetylglucosamine acyltransferase